MLYLGNSVHVVFDLQLATETLAMALTAGTLPAESELVTREERVHAPGLVSADFAALMTTDLLTAYVAVNALRTLCLSYGGERGTPTLHVGIAVAVVTAIWLTVAGGVGRTVTTPRGNLRGPPLRFSCRPLLC
jgi:hypothetical protein